MVHAGLVPAPPRMCRQATKTCSSPAPAAVSVTDGVEVPPVPSTPTFVATSNGDAAVPEYSTNENVVARFPEVVTVTPVSLPADTL